MTKIDLANKGWGNWMTKIDLANKGWGNWMTKIGLANNFLGNRSARPAKFEGIKLGISHSYVTRGHQMIKKPHGYVVRGHKTTKTAMATSSGGIKFRHFGLGPFYVIIGHRKRPLLVTRTFAEPLIAVVLI